LTRNLVSQHFVATQNDQDRPLCAQWLKARSKTLSTDVQNEVRELDTSLKSAQALEVNASEREAELEEKITKVKISNFSTNSTFNFLALSLCHSLIELICCHSSFLTQLLEGC